MNGIIQIPRPSNEPILGYAPGSPEKASLKAKLAKMLGEEITRTRGVVAQLTPVVEELKTKVFAKDREIVAKQAEAEAEAGGIGVTSKVGRGPKFRELSGQLRVLHEQKKNLELQLREFEKRLKSARQQASSSEGELSSTQGDIATQMGRAETAARLIREALRRTDGNQVQAAALLGMSRNGLANKMKRLGIVSTFS